MFGLLSCKNILKIFLKKYLQIEKPLYLCPINHTITHNVMNIQQSTFNRLVQIAKSNITEGKSIVIPALVSLIMEYKLCDNSNAQTLAVAVWNEASK